MTLTAPPTIFRAGDTLAFERTLADYPASDGWVLDYTVIGSAGLYSFTSTADGDAHDIEVVAATTATWAAGRYQLIEVATLGAARHTIGATPLQILPDLAAAVAATDIRTHARKVLDAIEAWLESRAPVSGSFSIAGRQVQHYPINELLALRDRYRAEVQREERAAAGLAPARILTRF